MLKLGQEDSRKQVKLDKDKGKTMNKYVEASEEWLRDRIREEPMVGSNSIGIETEISDIENNIESKSRDKLGNSSQGSLCQFLRKMKLKGR